MALARDPALYPLNGYRTPQGSLGRWVPIVVGVALGCAATAHHMLYTPPATTTTVPVTAPVAVTPAVTSSGWLAPAPTVRPPMAVQADVSQSGAPGGAGAVSSWASSPSALVAAMAALAGAAAGLLVRQFPTSTSPVSQSSADSCSRRQLLTSAVATAVALGTTSSAHADDAPPSYPQRLDPALAQQRYEESRLEEYNKRIQAINRVPGGFPTFIRDGYNVKIKTPDAYNTLPSGLIVYDFPTSKLEGPTPQDGQKVIFHYTAYNENGARIDSSYNSGRPLEQVVGIGGMVPGFEEGIKGMHIGGQRRIIVPPELGPPVGPSTFFSAKQYEVFDVELIDILDCKREGFSLASRLVCTKGPV